MNNSDIIELLMKLEEEYQASNVSEIISSLQSGHEFGS